MINLNFFCLLFFQFLVVFCINDDVIIHKNGLNVQMEHHVIAQVLTLTEIETDMNAVSKKISDEMNNKFGKGWICFTGINISFAGINFESEESHFIWFSFRHVDFIVFKQAIETSIKDPIIEARKSDAKLVMIRDEMPESMKNWIMIMVKQAIINFNSAETIAGHVVKILEGRYDYSWFCLVGSSGNDKELLKIAANSTVLSFKIESLPITIFQVKNEVSKCQNQVKFLDIVKKAKESNPEIIQFGGFDNATHESILNISVNSLSINFGDCETQSKSEKYSRCYRLIASEIYSNILNKFKGEWTVSVGESIKFNLVAHNRDFLEFSIGDIAFDIEKQS